jgi:hypothetical protein
MVVLVPNLFSRSRFFVNVSLANHRAFTRKLTFVDRQFFEALKFPHKRSIAQHCDAPPYQNHPISTVSRESLRPRFPKKPID